MPLIRALTALVLSAAFAFGQAPKEFEVASIRAVAEQRDGAAAGVRIDGSQVRISNLSLKDYVGMAYRIRVNQVVAPDWLASQRFDIAAKLPEGAGRADVNDMLRKLLVDRFQLKAHRDMKEFPVYALTVAKTGLRVMPSTDEEDSFAKAGGAVNVAAGGNNSGVMINLGQGAYFMLDAASLQIQKLTMRTFADLLTRFLDRPVVDMTNVKGGYDLKLDLTPEDRNAMLVRSAVGAGVVLPPQALSALDNASSDSLVQSLKKVGLSLEARRAPLEIIVVDDIQKTPSEN